MLLEAALAWPFAESQKVQFRGRAFGIASADLNIDFRHLARPFVVTAILKNCISNVEGDTFAEDRIWCWNTSRRLQALLTIAVQTQGPRLDLGVNCPASDCGELLELPLCLTDFEHIDDSGAISCAPDEETKLVLRLPIGNDQRRWWEKGLLNESNKTELARDSVTTVNGGNPVVGWCVDHEWLDAIEKSLKQNDPLNEIVIDTKCPHCGREFEVDVDLEQELLNILARQQPALLDDIHRIASAYHWTEDQILELTDERREAYLARIDEETP